MQRLFKPTTARGLSSYLLRNPSPAASREVPTPLCFVSASESFKTSNMGINSLAAMFAEKGFTCLETDLASPTGHTKSDSKSLMAYFESELRSNIKLTTIPFPPVLVSVSAGALIAQTYASSNPLSGLFMISPPAANAAVPLPTPLEDFNFELTFPIGIMGTAVELDSVQRHSRFRSSAYVDMIEVQDVGSPEAFLKMELWLDSLGI